MIYCRKRRERVGNRQEFVRTRKKNRSRSGECYILHNRWQQFRTRDVKRLFLKSNCYYLSTPSRDVVRILLVLWNLLNKICLKLRIWTGLLHSLYMYMYTQWQSQNGLSSSDLSVKGPGYTNQLQHRFRQLCILCQFDSYLNETSWEPIWRSNLIVTLKKKKF